MHLRFSIRGFAFSSLAWSLRLTIVLAVLFISACAGVDESPNNTPKKTLGDMYFAPVSLDHEPMKAQELASLRDAYADLLERISDPETIKIVQYRLADLEILLAEQQHETGSAPHRSGYYDSAIELYQQILAQHPVQEDNAEVLYQLAKAHDLQGQTDDSLAVIEQLLSSYPHSHYRPELQFRRGEIFFNRNDYQQAASAYQQVLEHGEQNEYFMSAAYMLGWSHFKLDDSTQALLAFTQLLDQKLPNTVIDSQMLRQLESEQQLEQLPVGEKRIVNDSIRIMSLLFSYQGAEQSLQGFYARQGERHYENLLYDRLAQQFLNDERFLDSARVYRAFTDVHPDHNQAPFFAVKQIDAYILGDYPTLVMPAKQNFVKQYGIHGPYLAQLGQLLQDKVTPYLRTYLQELAQFEHSKAQLLSKAQTDSDQTPSDTHQSNQLKAQQAFLQAADWYKEFIATFPNDDLTPQIRFNLAESLFEAKDYQNAAQVYEQYAYQYLKEPRAAEAGYAAILAYRALRQQSTERDIQQQWQNQQLASQQQFVNRFSDDSRALDVLYDSMQQRFDLQRYEAAIDDAQQLLDWPSEVPNDRKMSAHLVIAHSQFAMQQFQQAESSYDLILTLLGPTDPRVEQITERLAASIYRQAEQNLAKRYVNLAIEDLLRILAKAPSSGVRLNAQYDAATYLLEMQQWQEAINLLVDFRQRFSDHPLADNIQQKLIVAYQQNQDWLLAANELIALWQANQDNDDGREALLIAAQYYLKANEREMSLQAYRDYAHAYPQPFDEATEARFQMSEFYRRSDEQAKRRYWLNKLIEADADAGSMRTDRSRFLASMASMVFADDAVYSFQQIKLNLPLNKSLKRKQDALSLAIQRLNGTLAYQVAEFSTAANYKIAQIYAQLAQDLMNSERPNDLSALELQQYDVLLEEQAYPFEEQAIDIHQTNTQRSWQGVYDQWVAQSFAALSELMPGRYRKTEKLEDASHAIY